MGRFILALALCALSVGANAALFTFKYTGIVVDVDQQLISPFLIGQDFSITYTFDSTIQGQDTATGLTDYQDVIVNATTTIGSYSASAGTGHISISHDFSGHDRYVIEFSDLSGQDVNNTTLKNLTIYLEDSTDSTFTNGQLPLLPPSPSNFDPFIHTFMRIGFRDSLDQDQEVWARVDAAQTVPIPATFWLFGSAIGLLSLRYRNTQ